MSIHKVRKKKFQHNYSSVLSSIFNSVVKNLKQMEERKFFTKDEKDIYRSFNHALNNAPKVTMLDIRGQKRDRLPDGIERLVNIYEIDLSDNQFHTIPEGVAALPRLERIDISQTSIQSLEPLVGKETLKYLNCNDTKITKKDLEAFKKGTPDCEVVGNAKKQEQSTIKQKIFNGFMVILCMVLTYIAMRIITPTSETADLFLLGFGAFIIGTVLLAVLINYIVTKIKSNADYRRV